MESKTLSMAEIEGKKYQEIGLMLSFDIGSLNTHKFFIWAVVLI